MMRPMMMLAFLMLSSGCADRAAAAPRSTIKVSVKDGEDGEENDRLHRIEITQAHRLHEERAQAGQLKEHFNDEGPV